MHDRLIWAYQNDPLVRGCIDSGLSLEEIIDHLAHERARLMDKMVKIHNFLPTTPIFIREPDGRISPATSLETTPASASEQQPDPLESPDPG
jgi:hypothetical protein